MRIPIMILLAGAALTLASCGDSTADNNTTTAAVAATPQTATQTVKPPPPPPPPATRPPPPPPAASALPGPDVCLLRAGASNVEHTEATFWRAALDGGGLLRIERFASAAEAQDVVKQAVDIDAKNAGRYAVLGTIKGTGSKESVSTAADCLANG